jgi:hypothetical protein
MQHLSLVLTTLIAAQPALAHVGISNLTTPIAAGGQSAFAIANTSNEIQFNIPHGCVATETAPAFVGANLDTTKIEITVPAAIVAATTAASLRGAMGGVFGAVSAAPVDANGAVKLTWTKKTGAAGEANYAASDNQFYKVSVRMKLPNLASASDTAIKKFQFLVTQTCSSAGTDFVMDWGSANSPSLLVFPDRRKGFNLYTLDASALADFSATGAGTLGTKLNGYFGDAAIVWLGKSGYSANFDTSRKIQSLVSQDGAYSELGARPAASVTASDSLWVKY